MTHLNISDDLDTEIAAERFGFLPQFDALPADVGMGILRDVVEGVFPKGLQDAADTWPGPAKTERSAIIGLIAILTIAVEKGVVS